MNVVHFQGDKLRRQRVYVLYNFIYIVATQPRSSAGSSAI